jgi:hypothetical protein
MTYCDICEQNGYPEEPIRKLYNGRTVVIVDSGTGHKHFHKFSIDIWNWQNYVDNSEVSHWDQTA